MNGPKMICPACEKEVSWPGPCDDCKGEFDRVSKEIDRLESHGVGRRQYLGETNSEIADRLGISRRKVAKMRKRGEL